jgi:diguanylate cyclase (GGDEF)-like protein
MVNRKLLVVDDIEDNRAILARRFAREGFGVVEAENGPQALELIGRHRFDLVLLDIMMPDMDGFEVLERIRKRHASSELPVVMVTAKTGTADVVRALELGANDYITKPVDFPIALARVEIHLARKKAEEDLQQAHADLQARVHQLEEAIEERNRSNARIEHMSRHDDLTGIGNRVLLNDQLERAVRRVQASNDKIAVLCFDLNGFKSINETDGHAVGDQILKGVGARLRGCVSDRDTIARLGADKFAIIATEAASPQAAASLCDRILQTIAAPFEISGMQFHVTGSAGISLSPNDGTDGNELLKSAELAMAGAKSEGANGFQFFRPEMNVEARTRRSLAVDLRKALSAGELEVVYQPLLKLRSMQISSFEALLRWNHPDKGPISPADFIPIAEETNQIALLGDWVLRQACEAASGWPRDVKVAVNVSAVQLRQSAIAESVVRALSASQLPASRLELEITETALIGNEDRAAATLRELRALGVRISMDDFGTGYSSLSHLRALPFDKIKIDRSFIKDLPSSSDSMAILRSVTGLASSLNVETTAEGVETEEQLDLIKSEGCTEAQGFLIGRPTPNADVLKLISRNTAPLRKTA